MTPTRPRKTSTRPARTFRPRLEALDDRALPSISGYWDIAVPDAYVMPANSTLVEPYEGVLANDMVGAWRGEPLRFGDMGPFYAGSRAVLEVRPANGTLTWNHGGFTYTPNPGFVGVDVLTYHVESTYGQWYPFVGYEYWTERSNSTAVSITVLPHDAPLPSLTISDAAVVEGNGVTFAEFIVRLSAPSADVVTVDYETFSYPPGIHEDLYAYYRYLSYGSYPGWAEAWTDFTPVSGTLTFEPGETSKTISVPVTGDPLVEWDEAFGVRLDDPRYATVTRWWAQGTIINDDPQTPPPRMRIDDVSIMEGDSGTTNAVFTVTLSEASPLPVAVQYASSDSTAQAGSDYTAVSGTLIFDPGETQKTIAVPVHGDTTYESDETFWVRLTASINASVVDGLGQGTIRNDDIFIPPPTITIGDVIVGEGNSGSISALFPVSLSKAASEPVTVRYYTWDGTASGGSDYATVWGLLKFEPGQTLKYIAVSIYGDTMYEPDETFFVFLDNPTNGSINDGTGQGTILNDDSRPKIRIDDVSKKEGHNNKVAFTFTVTLSNASSEAVTVNYATSDGTAKAGSDYEAASGTLTFLPGETTKTITVWVYGDKAKESDETFFLDLTGALNAGLDKSRGVGTIQDDDR